MTGVYVSVPIASFRKGMAREYLETEPIPPPSTCYGFLLSLVGETERERHVGVRVTAARIGEPKLSVVLRRLWRIKNSRESMGTNENSRPDFQQLLTHVELVVWVDSSDERGPEPHLEFRVREALTRPRGTGVARFGGLSLGESTHLVNDVSLLEDATPYCSALGESNTHPGACVYLLDESGPLGLPVWVDHVGAEATRYAVGRLVVQDPLDPPETKQVPQIAP